jgi:hypothetical protein
MHLLINCSQLPESLALLREQMLAALLVFTEHLHAWFWASISQACMRSRTCLAVMRQT